MDQIGKCSHLSLNYDSIKLQLISKEWRTTKVNLLTCNKGRWIGRSYTLLFVTPRPISICHPIEPRRGDLSHNTLGIYIYIVIYIVIYSVTNIVIY
jgi:hypothetical protein